MFVLILVAFVLVAFGAEEFGGWLHSWRLTRLTRKHELARLDAELKAEEAKTTSSSRPNYG